MDALLLTQNQLLATKFHVPVTLGRLISRPRLTALLNESLNRPFTLVSAPAGFGKTTLLSTWSQSLLPNHPRVAWVSLEEEDNDPRQFWTYVLTALKMQQPNRFTEVLMQLQSPQPLPIKYVLAALINLLADGTDDFLLILDDYQMITEQEIHTILAYLIEHLPPQLRIILATRADPPLPLPLLRASQQALEVRTDQLRCTVEETRTFFEKVIGIQLPAETIQEVATRTEGWLVGLQLLGLSLPEHASSLTLLEQASGDQRYILDYLTQEVLQRQSQEVQAFLLSTSILERLSASLCDAIMEQSGSQQMLEQLEQANLFVTALDSKCQWYRYHALFAEALSYRLEQRHADRLSSLHHRASLWYAEHDQTTQAIVHAFKAQQLQWAADLIERKGRQLMSFTWGASRHALAMLQGWIEQLPTEVMYSRPRLCLACTQLLWQVAPRKTVQAWLDAAETILTASLTTQTHEDSQSSTLDPEVLQDLKNLLGEVITFRAVVRGHEEDGEAVLPLCQQALALLSPNNVGARGLALWAQVRILYCSSVNDAADALERWIQAGRRIQATGETALAIAILGGAGLYMTGTGQLRKIYQVTQETMQLARQPGGSVLPELCWPASFHAEILREWNQLDRALELIEEAILLSPQTTTIIPIAHAIYVLVMLIRIAFSRGELERARSALQELEHIENHMNRPLALHYHSLFTTVDQVRLWFACGERDRALRWAEELDLGAQHRTPFAREREEVAYARVRLATQQPVLALERLEPVLQRARAGQRWGHVIEIRLLQALAHQMCYEISQALEALSEAVRLAEPESFIRSFVEEGAPMAALLCSLREEQRKAGATPYLDTLLAAFPQKSQMHEHRLEQAAGHTTSQPHLDPLSERELEVLQLLVEGASNQEIAQALVIARDTVKRHVSHIFSKLGVQNRIQAERQARELRLLDEIH